MDNKADIQIKLSHLTIDGAREFWNEIEEWLDSIIADCIRKYDKVKTIDEMKEKQILKRLCERMKVLPENMVLKLRDTLANASSGDRNEEAMLNFITEPIGVKQEGNDG